MDNHIFSLDRIDIIALGCKHLIHMYQVDVETKHTGEEILLFLRIN